MKNDLKKLTARAGWLEVETVKAFSGGIGDHSFAPGQKAFARRNSHQPNIIAIIAPLASSPEQINGWFVPDYDAAHLIKIVGKVKPDEVDLNDLWRAIWNNITNLKVHDLGTLSKEFFKQ